MNRMQILRAFGLATLAAGVASCEPSSLVKVDPPGNIVAPDAVENATAALQLTTNAVTSFTQAYAVGRNSFVSFTGTITDEVASGSGAGFIMDYRDQSSATSNSSSLYTATHLARQRAAQAREALAKHPPAAAVALQGHMLSLEAYTVLMFAEFFCSGVPLSRVPLYAPAELTAGFTTQQLYERAVAMFDTAITLSADSTRLANLAKVGKARALMGLARYAEAAAAVQGIPSDFTYRLSFPTGISTAFGNYWGLIGSQGSETQVIDNDGGNGLVWTNDPRAPWGTDNARTGGMRIPAKFRVTAAGGFDVTQSGMTTPMRLADGLEARLIEAEAALAANNPSWLTTLNTLRATCVGTSACAPVPGLTATSLPPLTDPGTSAARVNLVMSERAYWLWLTGHRQGDFRRLARHYARDPETLYPTGIILRSGFPPNVSQPAVNGTPFGTVVVLPVPIAEVTGNRLYQGCFHNAL